MKQYVRIAILTLVLALPLAASANVAAITRADFVVNMMASKGLYGTGGHCFPDVTNQAFAPAVCEAKAKGYVTGYADGKFRPNQQVTLIDAAVMAMRIERVSLPSDVIWYRPAIEKLSDWNAIPRTIQSIASPLSVLQANEVLVSVRNRRNDDDDEWDDDEDDGISLSIDDSSDPIRAGNTVTYRIRLRNNDNSDARIDVLATLDRAMTFVSASDGGYEDDDVVEWSNVRVSRQSTLTLLLTVRAASSLRDGDSMRLRVRADGKTDVEDTRIGRKTTSNSGDIDVSITDVQDPVRKGEVITYRIVLRNNGNNPVRITVNAFLDGETSFVSASDAGDLRRDDEVRWENVNVERDGSKTLLLAVRPRTTVRDGDTVRLRVVAEDSEDTETTRIQDDNDADVRLSITDSPDPAEPGDIVVYRIRVENRRNRDEEVDVRARMDAKMDYVSSSHGGRRSGSEIRWDDVEIDANDDVIVTLTVRIRSTADDGDTVRLDVVAAGEEDSETTRIHD